MLLSDFAFWLRYILRTNVLKISKSGQRPRHMIMRFNKKLVSVLLNKGSWLDYEPIYFVFPGVHQELAGM